jgi:hypothetical protein
VALVGPSRGFEGFPSVQQWLKARVREIRARQLQSDANFVSWIAGETLAERMRRFLDSVARHGDAPVSPKTLARLRLAVEAMERDLPKTRPF